jgi:NADP-dependent 3-hydroxy acid dehydrogenase YdfG
MVTLENRKTTILGGTSGIGLATGALLTERGAEVTVGSRNEGHLDQARPSLPEGARAVRVDATDRGSLREFFDEVGPIDDLVDTFAGKPVAQLQAIAMALPTLDEHGSVTFVSAASAQSALPGISGAVLPCDGWLRLT